MNVIKAAIILRFEAQMKTAARKTAAFPWQVLPSPPHPPVSLSLLGVRYETMGTHMCVRVCAFVVSGCVRVCAATKRQTRCRIQKPYCLVHVRAGEERAWQRLQGVGDDNGGWL